MKPYRINFDGLLKSTASWAKVNRELLKALIDRDDVELAIQPRRGFNWQQSFPLSESLKETPDTFEDADARLTFTFPPLLGREEEKAGHHLLFSLYEATRLPPSWVEPLKNHQGTILVPSRHVEAIYTNNGIPPEKIEIVSYGYNSSIYYPSESQMEQDRVNVLTVATPHYRKGLDYLKSLSDVAGRENVNWRVHLSYRVDDSSDFWEDPRIQGRLEEGPFTVSTGTLSESGVASLMRQADLVVQPSRSEGFGLVILEAMACGVPVVTSDWGGHLDFAGPGMVRIDGTTQGAGRAQYHERAPRAEVFELNSTELRQRVRRLTRNKKTLRELGHQARSTVKDWTWERSADRLVERLRESLMSE